MSRDTMSTYRFNCGCENEVEFQHAGEPGALARVVCQECGTVNYVELPGSPRAMRGDTLQVRAAILDVFAREGYPLTLRRLYYALTVSHVVPKTQAGYRQVQYHALRMRRDGSLPYGWVADNTRWQVKPTSYDGLASALDEFQRAYRRDFWAQQAAYVEVWVEKDALASVIAPITSHFDVPLWVARGFSSVTAAYEAAEQIKRIGKPAYIYHFGDFDPSGVCAAYALRDELIEQGAQVHFERAAITEAQIEQVPEIAAAARPTKQNSHAQKLGWRGPSYELDAMPTPMLRELVRECIERHIDAAEWHRAQRVERAERDTLQEILRALPNSY